MAEAGTQGTGSKPLAEPGAGAQGEMPSVKRPRQDTMMILGVFLESKHFSFPFGNLNILF